MVNTAPYKRPFTSEWDRILNTSVIVNHFLAALQDEGRRGRVNVDERPSREILEDRNFLSRQEFFRAEIFFSLRSRVLPYLLRAAHLLSSCAIHEKWCTRGVSCLVTLSKIESFIHGVSQDWERNSPASYKIFRCDRTRVFLLDTYFMETYFIQHWLQFFNWKNLSFWFSYNTQSTFSAIFFATYIFHEIPYM